jgi:hypothetical protein
MKALSEWKPILLGAVGGAMAIMLLGFLVFGWVPAGTAAEAATSSARMAVIDALTPICVHRFNEDTAAAAHLVELKGTTSYSQGPFVEKGGWATMPGAERPMPGVAKSCADKLSTAS